MLLCDVAVPVPVVQVSSLKPDGAGDEVAAAPQVTQTSNQFWRKEVRSCAASIYQPP